MTYNGLEEDSCECSRDYRNILGKISVYSEFSFYTKNIDDFSTVYGNSLYPSLTKDSDNLFLNLAESGHFFWINNSGQIIYFYQNRTSCVSIQNLELLLSRLSGTDVKVFKSSLELFNFNLKRNKKHENLSMELKIIERKKVKKLVDLTKLPIVLGEVFVVNKKRFISYDNERTFYINKFCPDDNLVENIFITKKPDKYSIIMQYLYHISGYNKEKFNYIMSWLSSMMRYILNHEDTIFNSNISVLVLVGGENAGMEIFFNNIIKPLFGSGYCLAIDNEKLSEKIWKKIYLTKFSIILTVYQVIALKIKK